MVRAFCVVAEFIAVLSLLVGGCVLTAFATLI
jgi:hypothetical protein